MSLESRVTILWNLGHNEGAEWNGPSVIHRAIHHDLQELFMRVDFVITELFVGGAERCLTELAIGLAESGDKVRVFSLGGLPVGERSELVRRLQQANIPLVSGQADSALKFATAYRRLQSWFAESPPDICQTFMHHANVLGTYAARSSGVQIRVGGLRVAESRPFRCWIERGAVKQMQSLVCVSGAVETFAVDSLRCDRTLVRVIPNGVDVSKFATAPPFQWPRIGWPSEAVVTLFVGRLHPQKGIDLLQRQVDRLAPVDTNRRLLLVGDGPLRAELERWTASIGDDRVKLLPWQTDVAALIRAARLLILPSRYEGMPNVVLEAMASRRPVVSSRVQGSQELLSHSLDLQSFPPGDDVAMQQLAEAFLSDAVLCDDVGSENQSRVRNDFSIPAMVDAYRSHYRDLLADAARRVDAR